MAQIRVIPARDDANIEQKLVTLLLAAVQEKPDLIISVFAGTPAFGAYRLLVERSRSELVDFSRVRFVVFDELVTTGAGQFRGVLDCDGRKLGIGNKVARRFGGAAQLLK